MNVAFKEWALVCEALGEGRQSLILRKGGIAEGRDGFAFQHGEFFLFPTWFHEQLERTTLPHNCPVPPPPGDTLEIRYAASVEWSRLVTDEGLLRKLREFHVLADSVVEERFRYDEQTGIHIAFVRVFRLDPPFRFANERRYGGCRSWVDLPEPDGCAMVSVLPDEEHLRRRSLIEKILAI